MNDDQRLGLKILATVGLIFLLLAGCQLNSKKFYEPSRYDRYDSNNKAAIQRLDDAAGRAEQRNRY